MPLFQNPFFHSSLFVDGACSGNPGPGSWGAILCAHPPLKSSLGLATQKSPLGWTSQNALDPLKDEVQLCCLSGTAPYTTNNRMEMSGALYSLEWILAWISSTDAQPFLPPTSSSWSYHPAAPASIIPCPSASLTKVTVYSDSKYVVQAMTQWIFNWQRNQWKTASKKEVENKDLWQRLLSVSANLQHKGIAIDWQWTPGHKGVAGNEYAHAIAQAVLPSA